MVRFMRLIVGLGNPGKCYAATRHNVGFMVVDRVAEMFPVSPCPSHQWSHVYRTTIQNHDVLLVQPQTYMNRSGLAVREIFEQLQEPVEQLIIIYDDLDLAPGRLRIRTRGGHGGHKGVQSIFEHLDMPECVRIRIGIGRPLSESAEWKSSGRDEVVDYVLQPFQHDEQPIIRDVMTRAVDAIELIVNNQVEMAMNRYNRHER